MSDDSIKHLEFIQNVISRLSTNAFLVKGWALTVTAAFFGFSVKDVDAGLALVGLVALMAFWGLDAYFLSRERMYVALRRGQNRQPTCGFVCDGLQAVCDGQ